MASGSSRRFKRALRRVFKVRGKGHNDTKHVALVESPGTAAIVDSHHSITVIPENASIPHLDSSNNGPADLDELTCASGKSGLSCKTDTSFKSAASPKSAASAVSDQARFCTDYIRQQSTRSDCTSPRSVHGAFSTDVSDLQTELQNEVQSNEISSANLALTPRTMRRSCSTPYEHKHHEVPPAHSLEERFGPTTPKGTATPSSNSPTSVFDFLLPLQGKGMPPSIDDRKGGDVSLSENQGGNKTRPRSDSVGTAASYQSRKHDNQKSKEAFLALKKELEKNEFTKAAQVKEQAKSGQGEGSILTTTPSQGSAAQAQQQDDDNFEIIPNAPTSESIAPSVATEILDNILGIVPVSQSTSGDSQEGSIGSSYSSFDMESIGEITIDSATQRLIVMHKIYCENANVNENHPARMKKSNMRVSSAYAIVKVESDSSIKTEANRRLTWYDDDENLNKPFTLRTDESFGMMSVESSRPGLERNIRRSLQYMDQYLIPFAKQGLEKMFGSLNCGGNENSLEIS